LITYGPYQASHVSQHAFACCGLCSSLYKTELIHRRGPWKTKVAVEMATSEWVAWFNNHMLLNRIEYMSLAEVEKNDHKQQTIKAVECQSL
jgi:hypothetical protein